MKTVKTFTATIYVGFRERAGTVHTLEEARAILQEYVNSVGLCVSLTPTEFIYTNGGEPGCVVGLINYPRFPCEPEVIRGLALEIAEKLRGAFDQYRVSIVFPDETVMLGETE